MSSSVSNSEVARVIVEELSRLGIVEVFTSPGARALPLALAFDAHPRIRLHSHLDERGAAFAALGAGKGTGRPAVMLSTSGTPLANCYPAVLEASQARVPMLVLSADRPAELRETMRLEVVDQTHFFGRFVRWFLDIPVTTEGSSVESILSGIDQAYARSLDSPSGPVHLNVQFADPVRDSGAVSTLSVPKEWMSSTSPYTCYTSSLYVPSPETLAQIGRVVSGAQSGVIVVGALSPLEDRTAIVEFGKHIGWPIVPDILSGLRSGEDGDAVIAPTTAIALRRAEVRDAFSPDVVLHFGDPLVSKDISSWIAQSQAEVILVTDHSLRQDQGARVHHRVSAGAAAFVQALPKHLRVRESNLLRPLKQLENQTLQLLADYTASQPVTEMNLAIILAKHIPENSALYLANSLALRHAELFMPKLAPGVHVACNRNANGIDGVIASAVGVSLARGCRVTVVIGDQAFLNDVNSLPLLRAPGVRVHVVLVNNNGAGIFHLQRYFEPTEQFTRVAVTPHGLPALHPFAHAFGVPACEVCSLGDFENAYEQALARDGSSLIEVRTTREETALMLERCCSALAYEPSQ